MAGSCNCPPEGFDCEFDGKGLHYPPPEFIRDVSFYEDHAWHGHFSRSLRAGVGPWAAPESDF